MSSRNQKSTGAVRKNQYQKNVSPEAQVLRKLSDMFEDILKMEIINSVAQSCNFDLNTSINILIEISENNRRQAVSPKSNKNQNSNKLKGPKQGQLFPPLNKYQHSNSKFNNANDDINADVIIEDEKEFVINGPIEMNRTNQYSFIVKENNSNQPSFKKPVSVKSISKTPNEIEFDKLITNINEGTKILILLRGLPGSGKTFLAKKIYELTVCNIGNTKPEYHIYSADDYFVVLGNGRYLYNPLYISEAHAWNHKRARSGMERGISPIIIDNTNTMTWEMQQYVVMAVQFGYSIEVLEPSTPWAFNERELTNLNVHNVPRAKIREMLIRYERNITPQRLMSAFNLHYATQNRPPQKRNFPVINAPKKRYKERKKKNPKVNTNETKITNIKSDSEVVQTAKDKESSSGDSNSSETELINSTGTSILKVHSTQEVKPNDSNNVNTDSIVENCTTDSFYTESTNSHSLSNMSNNDKVNQLSKCWAFTLIMDNGNQIHSIEDDIIDLNSSNKGDNNNEVVETGSTIRYSRDSLLNVLSDSDKEQIKKKILERDTECPKPARIRKRRTNLNPVELEQQENSKTENLEEDLINWDLSPQPWEETKTIENSKILDTKDDSNVPIERDIFGSSLEEIVKSVEDIFNDKSFIDSIKPFYKSSEKSIPTLSEQKLPNEENTASETNECDQTKINDLIDLDLLVENNLHMSTSTQNVLEPTDLNSSSPIINKPDISNLCEEISDLKISSSDTLNGNNDTTDSIQNSDIKKKSFLPLFQDWLKIPFFNSSNNKKQTDDQIKPTDLNINENKIETTDSSTNTEDTDFKILTRNDMIDSSFENISILTTHNRNINMNTVTSEIGAKNNAPKILKLDKSSMTENENMLKIPQTKELLISNFSELMELFPDFPEDDLKDIFEKCKGDVNWAVDLLLDSKHNITFSRNKPNQSEIASIDLIKKYSEEHPNCDIEAASSFSNYEPYVEDKISFADQQSDDSFSPTKSDFITVKKKSRKSNLISEPSLQLKKQLEEQFVIGDDFYSEHCLKIKRLRHGEPISNTLNNSSEVNKDELDDSTETDSIEDEEEECIELDLGTNFINQLESSFGGAFKDSKYFESLRPVVQIPTSLARQIHALWLESAVEQLCVHEERLEQMVKEDEEFARRLQEKENENLGHDPVVSNLQEILDMEIAFAIAKSDQEHWKGSNFDELSLKLTLEKLFELFPDLDTEVISNIFQAHDNKFDQTVDVLMFNTRQAHIENGVVINGISREEILKQEQKLLFKVQEENVQRKESELEKPIIVTSLHINETGQISDMDLANYFRTEAQQQLKLRDQVIQKAQIAYSKGQTQVALYYSEVASIHKQNFQQANALAASSFLNAHAQANRNSTVLDLHYLYKAEALEALDLFIDEHISRVISKHKKHEFIYLITGRGARSSNGQSVIKPAVIKRLKQRNLRCIEINSGFLKVKIRPHDALTCNINT